MFPAVSRRLTGFGILGICAEGLWIRADFLYGVRLWEGHSTLKISLFNLYLELKARVVLPLKRNNKGQKTITHTIPQI